VSKQTGWPLGFWWSELTHMYWEFAERRYNVEIFSPNGGKLEADSWSDLGMTALRWGPRADVHVLLIIT
jgi:hypothetical protein